MRASESGKAKPLPEEFVRSVGKTDRGGDGRIGLEGEARPDHHRERLLVAEAEEALRVGEGAEDGAGDHLGGLPGCFRVG